MNLFFCTPVKGPRYRAEADSRHGTMNATIRLDNDPV